MKYPKAIEDQLSVVSAIVSKWPQDVDVTPDRVIEWILQFDEQDFDLAMRVIKNLNVIGQKDIDRGLRVAFSKLSRKAIQKGAKISSRNTLFAAMGDVGKSGAMISYHFRMNTEVSEENFLGPDTLPYITEGKIENIVLIDDIIGTGKQAEKEINSVATDLLPLGVKNIFVLSVCGMRDAIDKIEEQTKAFTFSAFEYSSLDTISSMDSAFYSDVPYDARERLMNRVGEYGKIAYPRGPLGFGGVGGLLVFPYNTPNTSLPILWSDTNEWIPLFRRVRRINGIASYEKQFKRAADQRAKQAEGAETDRAALPLTLFVEGKRDEIFFDHLIKQTELAKKVGVEEITVVGLGTKLISESLVKKVAATNIKAIFILDDDHPNAKKTHDRIAALASIIVLRPNFLQLLDLNNVQRIVLPRMGVTEEFSGDVMNWGRRLENLLFRNPAGEGWEPIVKVLVDSCLNRDEFERFVRDLRDRI